jgi:hypothetical protein
MASMIPEG